MEYSFLIESAALEFKNAVHYWDEYFLLKREMIAKELFPDGTIIFNRSHVTIHKNGLVLLGAYFFENGEDYVLLTEGPLRKAGFLKAKNFHKLNPLDGYIVPHGTGIDFNFDKLSLIKGIGYLL